MRPNLKFLFAAAVILVGLSSIACTPEETAIYLTLNPAEQAAVAAHLNPPAHTPPGGFLACVRRHESGGNYQAKNPVSTASGAYQYIRGTWANVSPRAGYPGYPTALSAPPYVQDAVAEWHYRNLGPSAWNGTGCS